LGAALLAGALVALSGCGAVPQSKYYELTVASQVPTAPAENPFPVALLVGPLRSSHLYRDDRLVYAVGNVQMGTYQIHRWTEPPIEMIQGLLWRSLRQSRRFESVDMFASRSRGDYLLLGNLYDLEEISGSKPAARVSWELELRDLKTGMTVWTANYSHDEPVNGKTVDDVVVALDQNVQHGIAEASASLDQYFAAQVKR
jgi:ABC-type uncharacterized transport system auxiliary subunit